MPFAQESSGFESHIPYGVSVRYLLALALLECAHKLILRALGNISTVLKLCFTYFTKFLHPTGLVAPKS